MDPNTLARLRGASRPPFDIVELSDLNGSVSTRIWKDNRARNMPAAANPANPLMIQIVRIVSRTGDFENAKTTEPRYSALAGSP
ncbi:MAG: hypothetical protein RLN85_21450, partial [Pseudomonadales bacterium]